MHHSLTRPISRDEFASNFQTRATASLNTVDQQLENFYYMLEDIALDFKYNKNVLQSYEFLLLFRMKFDEHIENDSAHYTPEQMEYATKVCRKVNETYYFNLIREKYFELLAVDPVELVRYEDFLGVNQEIEINQNLEVEGRKEVQDQGETHPSVQQFPQPKKVAAGVNLDNGFPHNHGTDNTNGKPLVVNLEEEKQVNTRIDNNEKPKEDKVKKFDQLLEMFNTGYANHQIDIAYKYYEDILELLKSKHEIEESQRAQIEAKMERHEKGFKEMERQYKNMLTVHNELSNEEGWIIERVRKNMTVKYKPEKGESVGIKFEMEIDVPIVNLLALIYEVDLYPHWFPFLKRGIELKMIHRAAKIAYTEMSLPPPVSNREAYYIGYGYDRLQQNGSIFLAVKTINDQPEIAKIYDVEIPEQSKMVRLDVKFFAFEILPQTREKSYIKAVANVDPKLKYIPMALINWTIRKFSHLLLEKMLSKTKNFKGSPWEKRIKENPGFYDWASQVAERYFSKNQPNTSNTKLA